MPPSKSKLLIIISYRLLLPWSFLAIILFFRHLMVGAIVLPPSPSVIRNLARGSALKITADLTGGLPMEVWKSSVILEHIRSRQAKRKANSTLQVLKSLLEEKGIQGMWSGCSARVLEGFFSGAVLLAGKEALKKSLTASPLSKTVSPAVIGFIAGAGGGAAQALVMTPTSFLVTATTAGKDGQSTLSAARDAWARDGIRSIYSGSAAVAARQATNWASRQGFTELVRPRVKIGGVAGEIIAGCLGGTLSCWNTPFEVARVHSQSKLYIRNNEKQKFEKSISLFATMKGIVDDDGLSGLYVGLIPRICQAMYQTVFLVCIPRLLLHV